jgi:tRNA/tmRNA/rRNA uracil-C5-methylase (TrmA/RlmC/RlmD family)
VSISAGGPIEPGAVLELSVAEAVHGGWCVARRTGQPGEPGSQVVFVRHALPGERVRAVITQATARFLRADAIEIVQAAGDRVRPPCPHARPGGCGGCDWQHASLPAQRALKAAVVRQQLARIAGIQRAVTVEPLPGDDSGLGWRTRVSFAVAADGRAGLHRHRSHEVVPVERCLIAHPLVTDADVTGQQWPGAAAVRVAVAPATGQRVVRTVPPRAGGGSGGRYLTHRAAGQDWRVGAGVFWQVHPGAADALAAAVRGAVAPEPGMTALDLLAGAGLFAGVLAEAVGPTGRVTAIDSDPAAVRDARHNLRRWPWTRVHQGDVAAVLGRIGTGGASVAVLDPPRAGLPRAVADLLGASPALRRIGYVSCDPATLARDLARLRAHGFELAALRAFDAFPMTHHVECLALLTRRG